MVFDRAFYRADDDARADHVGNAAVLADRAFDFDKRRRDCRTCLARFACLPYRNVDVRQTRDDSRSLEMDSAKIILDFRFWIDFRGIDFALEDFSYEQEIRLFVGL